MRKSFGKDFLGKKNLSAFSNHDQRNNRNLEQEKINRKYDILRNKVLSNHESLTNEKRKQLREKRLNTIFNKNDYYFINNDETQKNELSKNNNYSLILNEKSIRRFLEKYKELYNLTKNNISYFNNHNPIKKNQINYYLNILKINNEKYFSKNFKTNIISSEIKNISQRKKQLNRKYNNLKNEIFGNYLIDNYNNYNLSNQNIKTIINKSKIINALINIENLSKNKLTDSFNWRQKNGILINNPSDTIKGCHSLRLYSSRNITLINNSGKINQYKHKENRVKRSSSSYLNRFNNFNNKSLFKDKFEYFSKERINNKANGFKTRINLLSLK